MDMVFIEKALAKVKDDEKAKVIFKTMEPVSMEQEGFSAAVSEDGSYNYDTSTALGKNNIYEFHPSKVTAGEFSLKIRFIHNRRVRTKIISYNAIIWFETSVPTKAARAEGKRVAKRFAEARAQKEKSAKVTKKKVKK